MFLVIGRIADAMVRRFGLPDFAQPQLAPRHGRIPAFDVLYGLRRVPKWELKAGISRLYRLG